MIVRGVGRHLGSQPDANTSITIISSLSLAGYSKRSQIRKTSRA
jgi:hypothetical protein